MLLHIHFHFVVYSVDVDEHATIYDIKLKLKETVLNAEVDEQYLYFNSMKLGDQFEARFYGIMNNADLILRVTRPLWVSAHDRSYLLMVMRDETIMTLKLKIEELTRIAAKKMTLLYHGAELSTYENILIYDIPDDAHIDALEMYEVRIYGTHGLYIVPVHKMMTIVQLKNKLHTIYGIDHNDVNLRLPKMTNELADPVTLEVYRITKDGTKIYATCGGA